MVALGASLLHGIISFDTTASFALYITFIIDCLRQDEIATSLSESNRIVYSS